MINLAVAVDKGNKLLPKAVTLVYRAELRNDSISVRLGSSLKGGSVTGSTRGGHVCLCLCIIGLQQAYVM